MKLTVTQIALGSFLIIASLFINKWMYFDSSALLGVSDLTITEIPDDIQVLYENEVTFNIARYGSFLLPFLGIGFLINNVISLVKGKVSYRKLVVFNLTIGVFTTALLFVIITYGYTPHFGIVPSDTIISKETVEFLRSSRDNDSQVLFIMRMTGFAFFTGLATSGMSVAQLLRSRKQEVA